jgi:hypothetical protein
MNYVMFSCVFTYVGPTSAGECAICLGSTAQHRLVGGEWGGSQVETRGRTGGGGAEEHRTFIRNIRNVEQDLTSKEKKFILFTIGRVFQRRM